MPVSAAAAALLHLNAYCSTEFSHLDEKDVRSVGQCFPVCLLKVKLLFL
jgi:hypothetical protein